MSRNFVAQAAFLFLASAGMAAAQKTPPILVLQMPENASPGASQPWKRMLSITYNGNLSASRKIWARVFRGSKNDLKTRTPRLTPRNKCAVYAQVVVLHVDHGSDGQLRIGDLEDYFEMARGQQTQTFTLVFEEGLDPSRSEAIYLEKSEVARYFDNGIEVTLTADDDLVEKWHREAAAELAAAHPPQGSWFNKAFGIEPSVQAAAIVHPAAPAQPAAEPPPLEPHCQSVQPVPYRAQLETPSSPNPPQQALAPLFLRQTTACGE